MNKALAMYEDILFIKRVALSSTEKHRTAVENLIENFYKKWKHFDKECKDTEVHEYWYELQNQIITLPMKPEVDFYQKIEDSIQQIPIMPDGI